MIHNKQTLKDIALDNSKTLDQRANELLQIGLDHFNTELGIISKIKGSEYTVVYSNNDELIGEIFSLGNTYCSITMSLIHRKVFAVEHFSKSEHKRHPAYEAFNLETYIGSPVILSSLPVGTINFTKSSPREDTFTPQDKTLSKDLSYAASLLINQHLQ